MWAYGSYFGLRLSTLVATAILARLLVPQAFGLIAVATTFMAFLDMLQGLGVGQALVIAKQDELEAKAQTAFRVSVVAGVALTLVTAALAPAAASFFHQPRILSLMPALGCTFLLDSLGSTHYALAMRNMDFRSRTAAELANGIVRGIVSVVLAVAGAGVWSLVVGYLAGSTAMTTVLWRMVKWRPKRHARGEHLRSLLSFGGFVTGLGVMAAVLTQFDNLVVARVLGVVQLGYYSIATRIPQLFILSLAVVAGQVLFPAFASLKDDDLQRGFLTSLRYIAIVVLPITAFLITLAEPVTIAVFGARWRPAVEAARVLCLWAMMSPISMVCGNAFMSRGRADVLFAIAVPQAVALVAGSLLVARQGIVAVSWVQAGIAIIAQLVTIIVANRMFHLTIRRVAGALGPPIVASLVLTIAALGIHALISDAWPSVIAASILGGIAYLGTLHILAPDALPKLRRLVFPGEVQAAQ